MFSAWPQLATLQPAWFVAVAVAEAASFVSLWGLTKLALDEKSWFTTAAAQLSSTAVSRVMPGGAVAGGAVQYKMMVEAGGDPGRVATGLTATNLLLLATLVALPVLSLPAILSGVQVDRGLVQAAIVGGLVFVVTAAVGGLLLTTDRPLRAVARVVQRVLNRLRRHSPPIEDLPERLVEQRDLIRGVLGEHWKAAVLYAVGNKLLDFGALLAALAAVGSTPRPEPRASRLRGGRRAGDDPHHARRPRLRRGRPRGHARACGRLGRRRRARGARLPSRGFLASPADRGHRVPALQAQASRTVGSRSMPTPTGRRREGRTAGAGHGLRSAARLVEAAADGGCRRGGPCD